MRCFRFQHALLFAMIAAPAAGPLWARPHAKHEAKDQIVAVENQWVKAQIQGDVAAMEKLLSPDFLGINASGEVVTKTQQLDRMRNRAVVIHSLQISDVRVKLLGQHAASVTCLAQLDGANDGHQLNGSFRYTHVYQKLPNGMWSITNFEATRIPRNGPHTGTPNSGPGATQP